MAETDETREGCAMCDRDKHVGCCERVIRFEGAFDAATARDVLSALKEMPPGECVVLDFSLARHVDYHGFVTLVGEMSRTSLCIRLRGLEHRQVRMLRYFGLDPGMFGVCETSNIDSM